MLMAYSNEELGLLEAAFLKGQQVCVCVLCVFVCA